MSLILGMQSLEEALRPLGLQFSWMNVVLGYAGLHTSLCSRTPGAWGRCQSGMGRQQACLAW